MNNFSRGQAMLITILALGGTILGATTIAGVLMIYQIRQATDLKLSSKAIFAADAAIEWANYQMLIATTTDIVFADPKTKSKGYCYNILGDIVEDCDGSNGNLIWVIRGLGRSGEANRWFQQAPTSSVDIGS